MVGKSDITIEDLRKRESQFRDSLHHDLPAVELLDRSGELLANVIQAAPVSAADDPDPSPPALRHHALWMLGVIAFRASRASLSTLASGYEDQAYGFVRLIDEVHNRAQRVNKDETGEYSKAWLDGRPRQKPAKLAGQDFYEFLSGPMHANIRGVLDWIAVSGKDGSTKIVLGPERRPDVTNGSVAYLAMELRDIANLLANASGLELSVGEMKDLDDALKAAEEQWMPDRSLRGSQ